MIWLAAVVFGAFLVVVIVGVWWLLHSDAVSEELTRGPDPAYVGGGVADKSKPAANETVRTIKDRLAVVEIQARIAQGSVTFDVLEFVHRRAQDQTAVNRQQFEELFPSVLGAFERRYGTLEEVFFLDKGGVCGLTFAPRRFGLHRIGLRRRAVCHYLYDEGESGPNAAAVYGACDSLAVRVDAALRGAPREERVRGMLSVFSHLFSVVADATGSDVPDPQLDFVRSRLTFEDETFKRAAARALNGCFLTGMLLAIPVVGAVAVLVGWLLSRADLSTYSTQNFAVTVAMGMAGAMIGALRRMGKGQLGLTPDTERWAAIASGFSRPLVGAVFATVVYFGLASGLLGIQLSGSTDKQFFTLATLSFIVGFSERFALGLLSAIPGAGSLDHDDRPASAQASASPPAQPPSYPMQPPVPDASAVNGDGLGDGQPAETSGGADSRD